MNLPNKISTTRLLMIPVFAVIFYLDFAGHYIVAAAIFALAACTDFLDGYVARKYNLVTDLGKFLDSSADKVLVLVALVLAVDAGLFYSFWGGVFAAIIITREIMISCLRMVAASKGVVMAADKLGKWKTFLQDTGLIVIIFAAHFTYMSGVAGDFGRILNWIGFGIIAASVLMTIISGIHYLIVNKKVLAEK